MCIAAPMQVTQIDRENNTAKVTVSGNTIQVNISLISPEVGDYVLVHAGCAIEIINKEAADEITELFDMLEELAADESE